MLQVALCDDDETQLRGVTAELGRFADGRHLDMQIEPFPSAEKLLEELVTREFDIVFMDVEFHGKPQGIEAVRRINEMAPRCQVVYLTNYLQYSVDVYRTDHVWFVLKNQLEQRLPEVFDKLADIEEQRRRFVVITARGQGVQRIPVGDVISLERRKRITCVTTRSADFEVNDKLADIVSKLPETLFAYCHSSIVVSLPHVVAIHATSVQLDNGREMPMSRRYSKGFMERYFEWADRWTV